MSKSKDRFITSRDSDSGVGRVTSAVIYMTAMIVLPLLAAFFSQALHSGSMSYTLEWMRDNAGIYLINAFIFTGAIMVTVSVSGNLNVGTAIFVFVVFLLTYVSYFKIRTVGEPLLVWDFSYPRELLALLPSIVKPHSLVLLALCIAICTLIIVISPLVKLHKIRPINRICILVAGVLIVLMGCFPSLPLAGSVMEAFGVDTDIASYERRCEKNGFILSFCMGYQDAFIDIPGKYTENKISLMGQQIRQLADRDETKGLPEQPSHLVMVVNRGFWDPSELKKYRLDHDPLPTYRDLDRQGYAIDMVTPVRGIKVPNLEFELLTGLSNEFLPEGMSAYSIYLDKSAPTILKYLHNLGYRAVAVSAEEGAVWNREKVYARMGFDDFISAEDFPEDAERVGGVISDKAVAEEILRQTVNAEQPTFVFAVTAENSIPFDGAKYTDNTNRTEGIASEWAEPFDTYLRGLESADRMLMSLTTVFDAMEYPVKMCFMGSELPPFDGFYGLFHQGGFVRGSYSYQWSSAEILKMHTVPLVIWGNNTHEEVLEPTADETESTSDAEPKEPETVLVKDTARLKCESDTISAWLVPELMMDWAKLPMYGFYRQIWRRCEVFSVLFNGYVMDDEGRLFSEVPNDLEASVESYRILNYDAVYGYGYYSRYLYEVP